MAFSRSHPRQIATSTYFGKNITLYDGPIRMRTMHTVHNPTSVSYLPETGLGANVLVLTEGHQVRTDMGATMALESILKCP